MSLNLPAQWLLLHPMCAEQSYCLWQGYYLRRVMVIDTMSCCLPATCSAFFLTDFCMLEIQLFWVNSSCQETKYQHSNIAKALSCFCVLGFLFCSVSPWRNQPGLKVDDLRFDRTTLTLLACCCFCWLPSYQRVREEVNSQGRCRGSAGPWAGQ